MSNGPIASPSPGSMPPALEHRLKYAGPALFSYGFRPFFLGGAVWSVASIVLWVPQFMGHFGLRTAYTPIDWHIHEMLYGYVAAVVAGFLLTAVPNWTGRLPICGAPLMALAALWLLGRAAILASAQIGLPLAALIDVTFLVTLALVVSREIIAGQNWRNLRVLVLIMILIAGNIVFHVEVYLTGSADYGVRISIGAVIGLIMLVGGRVVPSFTNNWLARNNPGRLPIGFSRYDAITLIISALALASWIAWPDFAVAGVALVIAGLFQTVRYLRWAGDRTVADRLVLVLHVAYTFVPLGFLLSGAAILWPSYWPISAGVHAWTTGAVGLMTLAVMTRATLGHTGRPLIASLSTQMIYLCALVAAVARIAAAFEPMPSLLVLAAAGWILAFSGFAIFFGSLLAGRPPAWSSRK